jgi:hypothetical protein
MLSISLRKVYSGISVIYDFDSAKIVHGDMF